MRDRSVWQRACGLVRTVVEGVEFDNDAEAVIVSVRAKPWSWALWSVRAPFTEV